MELLSLGHLDCQKNPKVRVHDFVIYLHEIKVKRVLHFLSQVSRAKINLVHMFCNLLVAFSRVFCSLTQQKKFRLEKVWEIARRLH